VALGVLVLLVGVLAKTGPVSSLGLRVDRHIATHDRTSTLTTLARAVSTIATPEIVGVGLMILVPLLLPRSSSPAATARSPGQDRTRPAPCSWIFRLSLS
jgi:hypothetical protein